MPPLFAFKILVQRSLVSLLRSIVRKSLATMADKLRTTQQLEALQNKYIGTGHADTTKFEWTSNIARDSYASYVGHPPLLQYMTLAMGAGSREEMRVNLIEKMVRPVGAPPEVSAEQRAFAAMVSLELTESRHKIESDEPLRKRSPRLLIRIRRGTHLLRLRGTHKGPSVIDEPHDNSEGICKYT